MIKIKRHITIVLLTGIIAMPFHISGQTKSDEAFTITNNGSVEDIQPYKEALKKIDLEKYRLQDKRRILKFDTGVEVELKSADELSGKTSNQPPVYHENNDSLQNRVFILSKNGQIAEGVPMHKAKSAVKVRENAVQIEESKKTSVSPMPPDFPKYNNTGNPTEDQMRYKTAKEEWIRNNPAKYKQISAGDTTKQSIIPAEEYNKMSDEKKQVINNNPGKYIIKE